MENQEGVVDEQEKEVREMRMPRMITINQAVEVTGLSYDAIRKMCIRNEIVNIRVGKKFMINAEKLEQYLNGEEVEE